CFPSTTRRNTLSVSVPLFFAIITKMPLFKRHGKDRESAFATTLLHSHLQQIHQPSSSPFPHPFHPLVFQTVGGSPASYASDTNASAAYRYSPHSLRSASLR